MAVDNLPCTADGGVVLKDVVITRVRARSAIEHPKTLYPSLFDLYNLDYYCPLNFFYQLDKADSNAYSKFVSSVKNSLSKVLVPFYPLAGSWRRSEDAWVRHLQCDDEGAVFIEACIDRNLRNVIDLENYKALPILSSELLIPGLDPRLFNKNAGDLPLPSTIVQITRFNCSAVCLAFNANHMTLDGYSLDLFLRAWADTAILGQTPADMSICHNRSLVFSHLSVLIPDQDLKDVDQASLSTMLSNADHRLENLFKQKNLVPYHNKMFSVRKDVIFELKREAREGDESQAQANLSTFDCITARLWRCFARLPPTDLEGNEDEDVVLCLAVEGRQKFFDPPLPKQYFGNAVVLGPLPHIPSKELMEKPVGFAARTIHESVRKYTPETFSETVVHMGEALRSQFGERVQTESGKKSRTVLLASHRQFCIWELDFGFGKPFFFAQNQTYDGPQEVIGFVVILPSKPDSDFGAQLHISFQPESLKNLEGDPEFKSLISRKTFEG